MHIRGHAQLAKITIDLSSDQQTSFYNLTQGSIIPYWLVWPDGKKLNLNELT
jgi:hypothetical protein